MDYDKYIGMQVACSPQDLKKAAASVASMVAMPMAQYQEETAFSPLNSDMFATLVLYRMCAMMLRLQDFGDFCVPSQWHNYIEANNAAASVEIQLVGGMAQLVLQLL